MFIENANGETNHGGIPVGQNCHKVHFLHGSGGGGPPDGTRIGSYIIHYQRGQRQEVPIIYGQDVRDWWSKPSDVASTSELAWTGSNPATKKKEMELHLYKKTWDNPFPDLPVESIDHISVSERGRPFLIAITLE